MQRMPGWKAVAIERRHREVDRGVGDERPLPYEHPLQELVERHTQKTREGHDDRRFYGGRAVEQRQQSEDDIPDDPVAEAAGDLERPTWEGKRRTSIQLPADAVLGGVDPRHER